MSQQMSREDMERAAALQIRAVQEEVMGETVMLKNGVEVKRILALATLMSLKELITHNPITFYELVRKCRDSSYQITTNVAIKRLGELGMLENGELTDESLKNIVISAVEGEDLSQMALVDPVKPM
ncbi:MAG TPA: hypothetical protein VIQ31_02845 [Phormidium sp.]